MTQAAGPSLLPNLIIGGVSKAGTTSLFRYLAQHPQIHPADIKEVRYFFPIRSGRPLAPPDDYARHFTGWSGQRYRLESTPGYFYGGRMLAEAMTSLLDDPRVIVSLRDPASRFLSFFTFVHSRLRIPRDMDFDTYLERCRELRDTGADARPEHYPYWALSSGFYADWMPEWLDVLGPRLRVVFFDALAADPARLTRDLLTWLRLDPTVASSLEYTQENRTVAYRNGGLQRAALTVNRRGRRFFGRHRRLKRGLRRAYYRINEAQAPPPVPSDARARLAAIYAEANLTLASQLRGAGVAELPGWLSGAPVS